MFTFPEIPFGYLIFVAEYIFLFPFDFTPNFLLKYKLYAEKYINHNLSNFSGCEHTNVTRPRLRNRT